MPGVASRRCHLTLSATVWKAIAARAAERDTPVSILVDETLRQALGLQCGSPVVVNGAGESLNWQGRRRCRLSIEQALWERLAEEAAIYGVSVPMWIRRRLRVAVLGIDLGKSTLLKRGAPAIGDQKPDGQRGEEISLLRKTKGLNLCEF